VGVRVCVIPIREISNKTRPKVDFDSCRSLMDELDVENVFQCFNDVVKGVCNAEFWQTAKRTVH